MEFKPTYLYIKRHTKTNKLYFGCTTQKDVIRYNGSGLYWNYHLEKHGFKEVETLWYCLFLDKESIKECALMLSEQYNIVESEDWANMKIEDGINGGQPKGHTKDQLVAKDKDGNMVVTTTKDPRYLSSELVGITKGLSTVFDKDGNKYLVPKNDPRIKTGELRGPNVGKVNVKDKNGNRLQVSKDDLRYLSGELVGVTKGLKKLGVYDLSDGKTKRVSTEEFHKNKDRYHTIRKAKLLGLI